MGSGFCVGEGEELFDEGGEAVEVGGQFGGEGVFAGACGLLLGKEELVGEALQGVVDLVGEVVGHAGGGRGTGLSEELGALAKLEHGHGGEVGEGFHHAEIFHVEGLGALVGHDEDGALDVVAVPGKEEAVGDGRGLDAEDLEEFGEDANVLWAIAFEADAAGAGVAGEHGVEEAGVDAGAGDPVIELGVGAIFFDDADGSAVGTAEVDGGADEFLEDGFWMLDEGVGEAAEAGHLGEDFAGVDAAGGEGGVVEQVDDFEAGFLCVDGEGAHVFSDYALVSVDLSLG